VDHFIRKSEENQIKKFFMEDIDDLLKSYKAGEPSSKPDVLKQIKEIDEERAKMMEENNGNQPTGIMINKNDGNGPVNLKQKEVVELLQQHQKMSMQQEKIIKQFNETIMRLQQQLTEKQAEIKSLKDQLTQTRLETPKPPSEEPIIENQQSPHIKSKSQPDVVITL
jgi:predicted RNase H-like nuclease (RuvC/YqgF family)